MPGKLAGKKALITGGDSGIGRCIAIDFAREGADVAIVYRRDDAGSQETRREVEKFGQNRCICIKADVSVESEVQRVFKEATSSLGKLDILVNNAGEQQRGSWEDYSYDDFKRILINNIGGYFLMAKEALRGDYINEGGRIINTGSVQALEGSKTDPAYSATKGAIHTLTKSLAQYAMKKKIRVNCVAPGVSF